MIFHEEDEVVLKRPLPFVHHPGQPHAEWATIPAGTTVKVSHQDTLYRWTLVVEWPSRHEATRGLPVYFVAEQVLACDFHHKHPLMRLASET